MANITIRELADACGVSIGTVSKALRKSERISKETIEKIEKKAAELGYVGSQAARALSSKRKSVGLVLPSAPPEVLSRYRAGCREAAAVLSACGVDVCECEADATEGYDAILIHPRAALHFTPREGQAVAVFGGRAPALSPVCEVSADYRIGGRLAAQFLAFATGGAPCAILTARRGVYAEDEAVRGFRELSSKLGVSVSAIAECGDTARGVQAELRRVMAGAPRVRGVFVSAPIATYAAAALADLRKKPLIVAADFTRPAMDALRAGSIAALLYSGEERQVTAALYALADTLCGRVPTVPAIRQELVLKSNLEGYLL